MPKFMVCAYERIVKTTLKLLAMHFDNSSKHYSM